MVSGIVYALMGFVVHGWSGAAEFTNCGGVLRRWQRKVVLLFFWFCWKSAEICLPVSGLHQWNNRPIRPHIQKLWSESKCFIVIMIEWGALGSMLESQQPLTHNPIAQYTAVGHFTTSVQVRTVRVWQVSGQRSIHMGVLDTSESFWRWGDMVG